MSRERYTSATTREPASEVDADRSTGTGSGAHATLDRMEATDSFWSGLEAAARVQNCGAIDGLFLSTYRAGDLDRLVRNASRAQMSILHDAFRVMTAGGHDAGTDVALWEVFCAIPDGYPGMKRLCFQARWRMSVMPRAGARQPELEWDAATLKRVWLIFSRLPKAHTDENQRLDHLVRRVQAVAGPDTAGAYTKYDDAVALEFDAATIATRMQGGVMTAPGDPLENVNRFDASVRHEVGHAVDTKLGISDTYCKQPAGGGWKQQFLPQWIEEMIRESGAEFGWTGPVPIHESIAAFILEVGPLEADFDRLRQRFSPRGTPRAVEEKQHDLYLLVRKGLFDTGGYGPPNAHAGGRAFCTDQGRHFSYDLAARSRQVSNYQFKTPFEWVAEAYAAYYEPDPRGKGAKLADRDPETKRWFDQHVDGPTRG